MKKIWVTSLDKNEPAVGRILALAKRYGLKADGHFWVDDLKKMAWQAALPSLSDPEVAVWVVIGQEGETATDVGFGLTLLALSLSAERPNPPAILWLDPSGVLNNEQLPTPLAAASLLSLQDPAIGPKLVAKANTPLSQAAPSDYRLRVHANPGYGVWFELGPREECWQGAMFGVDGGKISFQGVGPAGKLPQKALLEHPVQGLELQLGAVNFNAWAVQNQLSAEQSYYVKIDGSPAQVLFGPYAADDNAGVFVLKTGIADSL